MLKHDDGIDNIWRTLRYRAARLPRDDVEKHNAVAAALRYVRHRMTKMRYASHYHANLPIGSGATESTCWQIQQRVKRPGQSWCTDGLRGVLATRALVLSGSWDEPWGAYAARFRAKVRPLA